MGLRVDVLPLLHQQRLGGQWLGCEVWGKAQGLRNVLGSKMILGTASELVLSKNRSETLINLRLLYSTGILPIVFLKSQQEPEMLQWNGNVTYA